LIQKVLLDTGPLVAFVNKRENLHQWAVNQWKNIEPPLLTCEAVITEACFLLQEVYGGEDAVMGLISSGCLQIPFSLDEEIEVVRELMRRYQSIPMSLADASLVRMSELYNESIVLTIDSDFLIYRKNRNQSIGVIIPNS
jgi:predicted nucleic acid-binding protein